jgi:hypothetical protein
MTISNSYFLPTPFIIAIRKVITYNTVTVDVDAMILLDASGSVSNSNWDKQVDVGVKVMDTIRDEVNNNHKNVGYIAWSSNVNAAKALSSSSTGTVQAQLATLKGNKTVPAYTNCPVYNICPAAQCTGLGLTCPAHTGGRQFSGGTKFSQPLAECAQQLLNGGSASSASSAFRMCMLVTDGEANTGDNCQGNTVLDTGACTKVCNDLGLGAPSAGVCTAKALAKQLRDQKKISIVTACVACPSTAKRDAYCYSDCAKLHGNSFSSCSSQVSTFTDSQLEQCKHFMIADDFTALDAKLVAMTKSLTTSLEKVVTGQSVSSQTETVTATTTQTETVTTKTEQVEASTSSGTVKVEAVTTSATAPAVTSSSKVNATESVDTNTVEEGCQDPTWFWLLIFFLPLIVYLLYYPFKRHYQAKKDRLRQLLHERRLLKRMQADEIRAAVQQEKEAAAAATAVKNGGSGSGSGSGGKKKKYKWDIKAADQYLWASSQGGAMKVDFGKMGAPASAPKSHHSNKELRTDDGRGMYFMFFGCSNLFSLVVLIHFFMTINNFF